MILALLLAAFLDFSGFSERAVATVAEATDSPTAITVAIIGAVGVIGGSWIDTRRQARRLDDNAQLRFAEVHHRLDRVEGRIDQLYLLHGREVRPRGLEEVEAEAAP